MFRQQIQITFQELHSHVNCICCGTLAQKIVFRKYLIRFGKRGEEIVLIVVWGAIIIAMVGVSYILQVLFHEIGHLVAGLITGWRLIYLQFFHIVLTKDKRIIMYMAPFSACQCIMSPKSIKSNSNPYTLGGLIANLVTTYISFYGIFTSGKHLISFLLSICFFSSGIALLMANGIPRINHICNDMACYLLTKNSKSTMGSHNTQFMIAEKLSKGKSYYEIEETRFEAVSCTELNDITVYSILLDYYYHLDRDEFMAAKIALFRITDFNRVSKNVQHIYKLELLYLHMLLFIYGCNTYQSSLLPCREEEEQYITENTTKGDVHSYRVNVMYMAFKRIREGDINGAKQSLNDSLFSLKDLFCIYSGEKRFCQDQFRAIINMLNRMTTDGETILFQE